MKNNDNLWNQAMTALGNKAIELKQLVLANQLQKELADKPLEQVLTSHLPASDQAQLKTAAEDIHRGVEESYSGLDEKVTDAWKEAHLNSALDGRNCNEKGEYLIKLLDCAAAVNPGDEDPRLVQLREADSYQEQDVNELMDMVVRRIDNSAGFLARQEFFVMEQALERLPAATVEAQMNSGPAYAEAYAAAMYITNKQSDAAQKASPYQMGLLAANSVESSHLLALYHYGKLRLEDLMSKVREMAERMLTLSTKVMLQALALGIRVGLAYVAGDWLYSFLMAMAITNTGVLLLIPIGLAVLVFLDYPQEEAVEDLTAIWNGVKRFVERIVAFFKGETALESPKTEVETANIKESQKVVPVHSDTNFVTV